MASANSYSNSREVSISALLAGESQSVLSNASQLRSIAVRDGIDLLLWEAVFAQPISVNVRDDWGRVQFSCVLQGDSQYSIKHGNRRSEYVLKQGMSCISYTPDCLGHSTHAGMMESVTVSVCPELLHELAPDMDVALGRQINAAHCCLLWRSDAQINVIAHMLARALRGGAQPSELWLLGQCLVLVGLALEAQGRRAHATSRLSSIDKQKLLRARDRLLTDLSEAPTIAMLAKETGLGILKLKYGFRELFQHSIYGLFQQERMHEAWRRLSSGEHTVMMVASDMGYANASHFAVAFQKQFGVKPSSLKLRR